MTEDCWHFSAKEWYEYVEYEDKYTEVQDGNVTYRIRTRTNGNDTCRSVQGCFTEKYIEPNMQLVIDTINKFENGEEE